MVPSAALAAGNTFTTNGSAKAEVMDPISVTHIGGQELRFGKFSVTTAGTVTVPIVGPAIATGGVAFVNGSNVATDRFTISGIRNRAVAIVTFPGVVTLGPNSMAFTTVPSQSTGVLSNGGQLTFRVGGTLAVGANQAGGTYTGTYTAGVIYN